ncbi:MAG: DUF167 domain-containing protein [bacterium]
MKIIEVIAKAGARERKVTENADGTITVRTTCPPDKGRANRDIIEQVADHLGLAKTRIEIISGQTYFRKRLKIK